MAFNQTELEKLALGKTRSGSAGVMWRLLVFSLMIFYAYFARNVIVKLAAVLAFLGFLASVYFVYLQVFVIKALCPYCLLSAFISTILFILSLLILRLEKAKTLN